MSPGCVRPLAVLCVDRINNVTQQFAVSVQPRNCHARVGSQARDVKSFEKGIWNSRFLFIYDAQRRLGSLTTKIEDNE
jgi:hypothetical protein